MYTLHIVVSGSDGECLPLYYSHSIFIGLMHNFANVASVYTINAFKIYKDTQLLVEEEVV